MILPPRPPTWQRWRRLSSAKYSVLRGLEYERLAEIHLSGRILDIGGLKQSSYYHLLNIQGTLDSINIDPKVEPTIVGDLNSALPLASDSYDNAISLNTFEHIQHDELAIREMVRVVKPGGHIHIIVPFLYRVHASPYDYHRHTAFWWLEFLKSLKLAPQTIQIEPLLWDPLSSAFSIVEFNFGRWRVIPKRIAMLFALLNQMRLQQSETKLARYRDISLEYTLGYYIHGIKR